MMSMLQLQSDKIKAARRETVMASYNAARAENKLRFLEGDTKATSEYIYDNQKEDAVGIVNEYYFKKCRVVSTTKKTKVGADGLMIEVVKLMTTHPDDNFVINPANVRILTGMSNASWEKDMKEKAPSCFKDKIFHHGQLKNADLRAMRDSLIIVDELDTGDKECQVLHNVLKAAGVLDVTYMEENNIRFMFISATMIKELYELYRWGDLHCLYAMTIPASYIGHTDFLARGIIQEFYPVTTAAAASRWIQEDILDNYGLEDCRIHIIRANLKTSGTIQNECIRRGILCFNHTSDERIEEEALRQLFEGPALTKPVVLIVKGFFRRANLIPNNWKLRIGATHEFYTKKVDNNVQIQALPGRMSGYWRDAIEAGHKTGPYRTSVLAVQQYEEVYNNPLGKNTYQTAGFKKKNGKVTLSTPVFVSPKNIANIVVTPILTEQEQEPEIHKFKTPEELKVHYRNVLKPLLEKVNPGIIRQGPRNKELKGDFYEANIRGIEKVYSCEEILNERKCNITNGAGYAVRPCYQDPTNKDTLEWWLIYYNPTPKPAINNQPQQLIFVEEA